MKNTKDSDLNSVDAVKNHVRHDRERTDTSPEFRPSASAPRVAGKQSVDGGQHAVDQRLRDFGAGSLFVVFQYQRKVGNGFGGVRDSAHLEARCFRLRLLTSSNARSAGIRRPASASAIPRATALRSHSSFSASFCMKTRNASRTTSLACAYAALYATEGVGLWLQKRWAEYLTTIATASLIPFEIWELTRGASATKVAALAINIAIVIYLIWVLRTDRRAG